MRFPKRFSAPFQPFFEKRINEIKVLNEKLDLAFQHCKTLSNLVISLRKQVYNKTAQGMTNGVQIEITSHYNRSMPVEMNVEGKTVLKYYFQYQIKMTNHNEDSVQLVSRKWIIDDSAPVEREFVEGPGVIGQFPILKVNHLFTTLYNTLSLVILPLSHQIQKGETFTYSSGCYLQGTFGTMCGKYFFQNLSTNTGFEVDIPPFSLRF